MGAHTVSLVMGGDEAPDPEGGSDEGEVVYEPGSQRPMEQDRFNYLQPGRLAIGRAADGLPTVLGEGPEGPEPGLTDDNLVCSKAPGRPACSHLRGVLTNAPGIARGYAPLRQVRRFCVAMATSTELFDLEGVDIFSCLSRDPVDKPSLALWDAFEERQKNEARDSAQTTEEIEW